MRTLGIVPARGGSKGVPRKNVLPLAGVPLIVHTLRAARAAGSLDALVVSTDDDEIAAVAAGEGVQVVRRPAELSRDESPTEDALLHALDELGADPEWVVTLEPTSPLRRPETIDRCVELAAARRAGAVVTVVESRASWGAVDPDGRFRLLRPGQPRRRQAREPVYAESGTVWVTRTASLRELRSVLAEPVFAVVVDEEEALDVNSGLDLIVAEALLRA